jgi:hypothetical protein
MQSQMSLLRTLSTEFLFHNVLKFPKLWTLNCSKMLYTLQCHSFKHGTQYFDTQNLYTNHLLCTYLEANQMMKTLLIFQCFGDIYYLGHNNKENESIAFDC